MKLFIVHAGFYDNLVSDGFYESHTNYFLAAENLKDAKSKAKRIPEFKHKKMHIDGIMKITRVNGYKVRLEKDQENKDDSIRAYDYDTVKKL